MKTLLLQNKFLNRLRLLLLSIPVVIAVMVLRVILREVFNIGEVATFAEIGSVITGVTLILGFMLGGVLADYKESEKLPAVVAVALTSFYTTCSSGLALKEIDARSFRQRISEVGIAINSWCIGRISDEELWKRHSDLALLIVDVEKSGVATHYLSRLMVLNGELTGVLSRIAVIRNTSFVQSGYVLMSFLVLVLQVSLAVVSFPSTIMSWIAPSVLSLAYAYLLLLVKDLDNPFGHGTNDGQGSGADVDISPIASAVQNMIQ